MIVFIDFDDVIFNTKRFKDDLKSLFLAEGISEELFDKHYYDPKDNRKLKMFDPVLHALRIEAESGISTKILLKKIEIFLKDVSSYVFSDFVPFAEFVGKQNIYLISFGEENFVKMKMAGSGILEHVNMIKVVEGKKSEAIREIISSREIFASEKIFFLDDRSEQIADVKNEIPKVVTMIMKRPEGRYDDAKEECCDYEVKNLKEVQLIIDSFDPAASGLKS